VVSNTADNGGGVHFLSGGTLNHCIIRDNLALTSGGGVNCEKGGTVRNCTISGNESIQAGGGAWLGSNGRLENCIVGGNSAAADGGGVFIHTSGGTIRNCTISGNTCVDDGGGVMCNAGSTIQNTIIHMNAADRYGDNWYTNGAGIAFTYCCTTPTNKLPGGTGCIDVNPKFADPVFHLQSDSPCIDTGTEIAGVTNDLDGSPRPMDGDATGGTNTDIGAYEYARADLDTDGDGLDDWEEVSIHGTAMNSADIDGDGITDPDEITMGFNPRVNNSDALAGYGLYTSNSIYDLSMGTLMGAVISGDMNLDLQLQGCTNLGQGAWTNIGAPVPWSEPADDGKSFFRVWSGQ
ncbi:MAG: right-handed parallel beta-helix repeat-containing protein, partial [Verrucomicrobia bacterium]|nr:right-handed parallel beta-helix repeat-containing protein [Verrucomicrobiota bacterium]